jgi:predicted aspartyl protease
MRFGYRRAFVALAFCVAAPILIGAESTTDSARSEVRLQLADLLYGDQRYWEALSTYENAKQGARPEQLLRASSGLLKSLLHVAEFTRAQQEADFLYSLDPVDSEYRALYADALWAFGLFTEAEQIYQDVLDRDPGSAAARHGLGRSLAARGRLDEGLVELQAALSGDQRGEFYHTLGSVYRRMQRYDLAADAFESYVEDLAGTRMDQKIEWARSEIRFLRSFGERVPVHVSPEQRDSVHTVPFRLERDKVIVRGSVNGGSELDLVVDTGAEQMVLSQATAQRVGVRPITNTLSAGVGRVGMRGLELGRADTLQVGTLSVDNVPALIKNPPLTGLPQTRSENSFSPLAFGMSTIVDYENHRLVMARELPSEAPADVELPMRYHRLALVRGVINGSVQKSFIVDTGGEVISISLSTANALGMVPVRHIPLRVFGTSGWDDDAFLLPGVNLGFDRIQFDNFSVVVLNLHRPSALLGFHIGGIIGHTFLGEYRVAMDLKNSVLRLTEIQDS